MTERQPFKAKCQMHGGEITLMVRPEDVEEFYGNSRRHIQDIFDYLTPAEREMFQSGICGECWSRLFPPDQEGPDGDPIEWADLPTWVKGACDRGDRELAVWKSLDWRKGDEETFFAYTREGEYVHMFERE